MNIETFIKQFCVANRKMKPHKLDIITLDNSLVVAGSTVIFSGEMTETDLIKIQRTEIISSFLLTFSKKCTCNTFNFYCVPSLLNFQMISRALYVSVVSLTRNFSKR